MRNDKRYDSADLGAHIAPLKGHNWNTDPKLALAGLTTLEKTEPGYVLRLNDDGGASTQAYTITYHRPDAVDPATAISVNVIGMVNNPGAYKLAQGATLLDALTAAGGYNRLATRNSTRITRGAANQTAQTFTINVDKLLRDSLQAPILQDHDTVSVPERVF